MSWDVKHHDRLQPKDHLPYLGDAAGSFGAATTEYVVFDTTRIPPGQQLFLMDAAPAAGVKYRQTRQHIKRAWLSVRADQQLSFYHRHLSILAPANASVVAGDWDAVLDDAGSPASPTVIAASANPTVIPIRFFGDDHQLVLKTSGTPPTIVHLSLRLLSDQALMK
jgi:hypothetical protein